MPVEDHPRPLDHLVLPVSGLDASRERLRSLGFTVAPDGFHPFGTANCCVFFPDGTFLEPLTVADETAAEAAARNGNVFARHALDFRARHGPEGFSALVFGTENAGHDHDDFRRVGYSGGDMLTFSRDFKAADGTRDRAEFRLAFASSSVAPACLLFTCERVQVPDVDRSALQRHDNGVTRIGKVLMTAPAPSALAEFLEQVSGVTAETAAGGIVLRFGEFEVIVLTPSEFAAQTGQPEEESPAPMFRAVTFMADDIEPLEARLNNFGIACHHAPAGLVVPAGQGQGTTFIFSAA
jgi:hypothetical protein